MTDWVVRRWARYGHERLYAETPDGTSLGYFDVKTGRYYPDEPAHLPLLNHAIAAHPKSCDPKMAIPEPYPTAPHPEGAGTAVAAHRPPPAQAPEWQDLSTLQPGTAARERARAQREAQGRVKHWLARLVGAQTDERAWRIGADGELAVAQQLATLGPRWHVLHAVPVGARDSDIDHVVIGPGGVFTVNAKHHPSASIWVGGNTFMVNGHRVPYIRNSRHEALRAARMLTEQTGFPVTAVGIIAVMGARKGMSVKKQPEDGRVVVVQRRRISRHLNALPEQLTAREIEAIYDVARRSTTWRR